MAITTNFQTVEKRYQSKYWDSIDEFEEYYLLELSERLADTNYYTDRHGVERKIKPINHFPELKEYEVWEEGYSVTGNSESAHLVGKVKARSFAQACHILMCQNQLKHIAETNSVDYTKYCTPGRWDYDPSKLSYWGCQLFWSEKLARKAFN